MGKAEQGQPILSMKNLSKMFNKNQVVKDISLDIYKGEILTLLGPSGCGKTTTLRMVMGLERSDGGEILYRGNVIDSISRKIFLPTSKRNMGMVFQSYAIWPQMTVFENVAFPLRVRKENKDKIKQEVERALSLVGLIHLADRPAPQLSGGQQQRVAFARSLVYNPDLLLLDEPFSNLDARLREQMRIEVKELQKRIGISVLFVTHDQVEALTLSDRIAVMNQGVFEQVASPKQLYDYPATPFVRDFLGQNIIFSGHVHKVGSSEIGVILKGGEGIEIYTVPHDKVEFPLNSKCEVSIRPEKIDIVPFGYEQKGENRLTGEIQALYFTGDRYESRIKISEEQTISISLNRNFEWSEGQKVSLSFPKKGANLWVP